MYQSLSRFGLCDFFFLLIFMIYSNPIKLPFQIGIKITGKDFVPFGNSPAVRGDIADRMELSISFEREFMPEHTFLRFCTYPWATQFVLLCCVISSPRYVVVLDWIVCIVVFRFKRFHCNFFLPLLGVHESSVCRCSTKISLFQSCWV